MAIALDAKTTSDQTGDGSTTNFTFSHTCTGADLSLVVIVRWIDNTGASPTVSSVTYNGVPLTFRVRAQINYATDNYITSEVWTLDSPATGSNTVSVTFSEAQNTSDGISMEAISFTGANNGIGTNTGSATGTSSTPAVTFTTGANDSLIVGGLAQQTNAATPYTPGSGVTEADDGAISNISYWSGYKTASGGSDTLDATASGSFRWAEAAIELKAAVGGGGGDVLNRGLSNIGQGVIASGGGGHSGLHPIEEGYI